MSKPDINSLLGRLGLKAMNPGAWSGSHGWSTARDSTLVNVRNPADGALIAQMRPASAEDYENVIASAAEAAAAWRHVPAPKRGEAVRLLGEELRRHKSDLGTLVSLENGKIIAEGLGEVQEMIDIADFAVGQSRMLYGSTMHPNGRSIACTSNGIRSAWLESSRHLTSRLRCGRGTLASQPSAATCPCGSLRRKHR